MDLSIKKKRVKSESWKLKKKIKERCRDIHVVGLKLKWRVVGRQTQKEKKKQVYCVFLVLSYKEQKEEEGATAAIAVVTGVSWERT